MNIVSAQEVLPSPPSRAQRAADEIRRVARAGAPGDRLGTKQQVRERIGVAAGTMNEAVRLLEIEGWIELRRGPGGGIFVGSPAPVERLYLKIFALDDEGPSVAEAFEVRAQLDELIVQHAAIHATTAQVALLRQEVDQMQKAYKTSDQTLYVQANWRLHEVLCSASPNELLQGIYRSLLSVMETHVGVASQRQASEAEAQERFQDRIAVHARLVDAVASGEPAHALRVIREHNAGLWGAMGERTASRRWR